MNSASNPNSLCVECGRFYGSSATLNMCSQCYTINKPSQPAEDVKPSVPTEPATATNEPARCACCSRKLGVMPLSCKCGKLLCKLHHLPEEHECTVNYRELGTKQLKDKLQQLRPKKINDIN